MKLSSRAQGQENGMGEDPPRPHGAAAGRLRLPVPQPGKPGVLLVQTILGENTVEKWAEICQTHVGFIASTESA